MNKQDKKLVDDFLARTEKNTKAKKHVARRPKLTKAERQELNKAYMQEMVIDIVILAVAVILVVVALAWIVGKLNGQNC